MVVLNTVCAHHAHYIHCLDREEAKAQILISLTALQLNNIESR